jgi:hypothetical protein
MNRHKCATAARPGSGLKEFRNIGHIEIRQPAESAAASPPTSSPGCGKVGTTPVYRRWAYQLVIILALKFLTRALMRWRSQYQDFARGS